MQQGARMAGSAIRARPCGRRRRRCRARGRCAFEAAIAATETGGVNAPSGYVAQMNAAYAQRHRAWLQAEQARARLKADWAAFFEEFDVLIAPCSTVAAFPLDEARPREEQVLRVNGRDADYNNQLFWAGLATLPSLPATAVPIGLSDDGLPLDVQVIGAAWEDRGYGPFIQAAKGGVVEPE